MDRADLSTRSTSSNGWLATTEKPFEPPEPKAELRLLALLGTKPALVVMSCLLAVAAFTLIVLLVATLARH